MHTFDGPVGEAESVNATKQQGTAADVTAATDEDRVELNHTKPCSIACSPIGADSGPGRLCG